MLPHSSPEVPVDFTILSKYLIGPNGQPPEKNCYDYFIHMVKNKRWTHSDGQKGPIREFTMDLAKIHKFKYPKSGSPSGTNLQRVCH